MLINSDTTINNCCNEDITVSSNTSLTLKGICSKTITLQPNSNLVLTGICNKLEISNNSSAVVTGTVSHIINKGSITIDGIVDKLEDISKNAVINNGAIINGKKY